MIVLHFPDRRAKSILFCFEARAYEGAPLAEAIRVLIPGQLGEFGVGKKNLTAALKWPGPDADDGE